jgi:hypothetical protein
MLARVRTYSLSLSLSDRQRGCVWACYMEKERGRERNREGGNESEKEGESEKQGERYVEYVQFIF